MGRSRTFTTWLYVENGVGVAEKFLCREGVGDATFLADMEKGIRTEGIRNLRRTEAAILVVWRWQLIGIVVATWVSRYKIQEGFSSDYIFT